jgi:hypothetical protein
LKNGHIVRRLPKVGANFREDCGAVGLDPTKQMPATAADTNTNKIAAGRHVTPHLPFTQTAVGLS